MSFSVLFVCTGNICRSPMAERLLQHRLAGDAVTVSSAGTRAMVGYGMDRAAAHVLQQLGGDPDGHAARQISPALVGSARLVLTATTAHRDTVIRATPAAMRRTFTMREFVRLAGGATQLSSGDLPRLVLEVSGERGVQPPAAPGADDIGDPYGASLAIMEQCGREVSAVVDALQRLLAPTSSNVR